MKFKLVAIDSKTEINELNQFLHSIPGWTILERYNDGWRLRSNCLNLSNGSRLMSELIDFLVKSNGLTEESLAINFANLNDISGIDDVTSMNGLVVSKKILKVLFLSNVGSENGLPMLKVAPNLGSQRLAQHLRISLPCDAVVYDANLDRYIIGANKEIFGAKWDIVAHGYMDHVIHNDIQVLNILYRKNPNALFVAGGPEISRNSIQANTIVFKSIPYDIGVLGSSFEVMRSLANTMIENYEEPKDKLLVSMKNASNTFVLSDGNLEFGNKTNDRTSFDENLLSRAYEPILGRDIFHRITYSEMNTAINMGGTPLDNIGRNALKVLISNKCTARCIFCGSRNFITDEFSVRGAFQFIREELASGRKYDSISFRDNDLFNTPKKALDVLDGMDKLWSETGLILPIKAQAKVRSILDLMKIDKGILQTFNRLGFRIISFGIESFYAPTLDFFGGKTTVEENHEAINALSDAGIRVGMFMILASPVDTIDSIIFSVKETIKYLKTKNVFVQVASKINLASSSLLETNERLRSQIRENHYGFLNENLRYPFLKNPLIREATIGLNPKVSDLFSKIQGGSLIRVLPDSLYYKTYDELKDKYGLGLINQFSVNLSAIVYLITFVKGVAEYYPEYLSVSNSDSMLVDLYDVFDKMFIAEHANHD